MTEPTYLRAVDADHDPRTPPQDVAAERAVLGGMLMSPSAVDECTQIVTGADFYRPAHEIIFNAIDSMFGRHLPVDAITVADRLTKSKDLDRAGGQAYLHDLISAVPTAANAGYYAEIVAERACSRRLIEAGTRIAQMGYGSHDGAIDELVAAATAEITAIPTRVPGVEAASDYLDFTDLFTRPIEPVPWLVSPVVAEGRITLLYSPGKVGKSLIAMEAAVALATGRPAIGRTQEAESRHCLYIDQEMTPEDWHDRLADMGVGADDGPLLNEFLHLANLHAWPPLDSPAGGQAVLRRAKDTNAALVIIDTASKVIAGEENSNDTQQALYRCTLAPLKRAGIAVLILDHTGKDLERGARGGSAKTDNVDLAFKLLLRAKDRLVMSCTHARFRDEATAEPTYLHRTTKPLAHVIEEGPSGGGITDEGTLRPTHLMERVSRFLEINPGSSRGDVERIVRGKTEFVRLALQVLVTEGYVNVEKGGSNKSMHRIITPFREDEDSE